MDVRARRQDERPSRSHRQGSRRSRRRARQVGACGEQERRRLHEGRDGLRLRDGGRLARRRRPRARGRRGVAVRRLRRAGGVVQEGHARGARAPRRDAGGGEGHVGDDLEVRRQGAAFKREIDRSLPAAAHDGLQQQRVARRARRRDGRRLDARRCGRGGRDGAVRRDDRAHPRHGKTQRTGNETDPRSVGRRRGRSTSRSAPRVGSPQTRRRRSSRRIRSRATRR